MPFFSRKSSSTKRSTQRKSKPASFRYDNLETRQLLAGDVKVFLAHDQLFVRGDAAANQIQIRGTDNGTIEVVGEAGTTINGQADFRLQNVNNQVGGLRINMGAGDDSVFVEDLQIQRTAMVFGGQGGDSIGFYQVDVRGDLGVHGGWGNNMVSLDDVDIAKRLILTGDDGADTFGIDQVNVGRETIVLTGNGNDRLGIRNSVHRKSAYLNTQSGNDFVSAQGVQIQDFAFINTGAGNDDFYLNNSNVSRRAFANGGSGIDQLEASTTASFSVAPSIRNFEGTDVANEESRAAGVFNDLITDGARLGTILELASLNPNFSTLVGAVQATGLVPALSASGPFTVFAPLNSAFEKISGVVASLTTEQLTNVLKFHVVSGAVSSSQLVMMSSVETLLGQSFSVSTTGGNVVLNGNATLAATDIRAKNGIIHVLNDVLVPVL